MALNRATFMRKVRRFVASFIPFVLAVSTLSAISIVTAPSANADTAGSGNCVQTFTPSSVSATVTVTESGGFCYVVFKNIGAVNSQVTFSWTRPAGLNSVDVLVVGGGGGGGARHGGGGGAGGFIQADGFAISSASTVDIAVGAGGAGSTSYSGTSGQASYFRSSTNGLTAPGGGFGANAQNAGTGGSGGGAGAGQTRGGVTAGTTTNFSSGTTISGISFGNIGAAGADDTNNVSDSNDYWAGGGGGGAGAAGENPKSNGTLTTSFLVNTSSTAVAGKGGDGKSVSWITPAIAASNVLGIGQTSSSLVYFAGGGGGGMGADGQAGGPGGLGGGATGTRIETSGNAGTANTGGGGGGSGFDDINKPGSTTTVNAAPAGAGGSGVVVLRYQVRPAAPTITGITGGNNSLSVAFTAATQADVNVTGYKFSTDGGSTWSASTGSTSSPISITGLTNATAYQVQIRAVSAYWDGVATASTSATAGATCSVSTSSSGGYTTQVVSSTGACVWSTPSGVTRADVLVVGGGGGGSGNWTASNSAAGSGGGGGVYTATAVPVSGVISVVVGAGGAGGTAGTNRTLVSGSQGETTSFGSLSAGGGGGGGCPTAGTANGSACTDASIKGRAGTAAGNGGSPSNFWNAYNFGEPGNASNAIIGGVTFNAISGFRGGIYDAGAGRSTGNSAGSGGGAGAAGTYNTPGAGVTSTLTGSTVYGRGGSSWDATTWNVDAPAANSGFGGNGAHSAAGTATNGVSGASGIVVIRYANALTVTYDSQDGSAITSGSTITGGSISASPGTPTRNGFTFTGWFVASTGGTAITFPYTHNQTASFTLYAQWSQNFTITVNQTSNGTINYSGSSAGSSVTVTSGSNPTFTFVPNAGFEVESILIDGVSLSTPGSPNLSNFQSAIINGYSFSNVTSNRSISATYAAVSSTDLLLNLDATRSSSLSAWAL